MGNFWVVLVDSNPTSANVKAFFRTQEQAVAWRDSNSPGSGVFQCTVPSFISITQTNVPLS